MEDTILYRGYTINITRDDDATKPDEWDSDAFIVYDHRDFYVKVDGFEPDDIFQHMQETKKKLYDGHWYFPVFAYIHSGVMLSLGKGSYPFTCPWDTSFKGFALVKRIKGWSWTEEQAREKAQYPVDNWNDYLSGNVYGYEIVETDDSCWGFYGDPDKSGIIEEAKASVDSSIRQASLKHFEQLKTWIRNKVPFMYRKPLQFV